MNASGCSLPVVDLAEQDLLLGESFTQIALPPAQFIDGLLQLFLGCSNLLVSSVEILVPAAEYFFRPLAIADVVAGPQHCNEATIIVKDRGIACINGE